MVAIELSNDYGLVLLAALSTCVLSTWQGLRVGGFRKAAKIPYPFEYASFEQIANAPSAQSKQAMLLFNSAQRAHQHYGENHTSFVTALLVGGLVYPRLSAGLGVAWAVNRVLFAVGYTNGKEDGKGRYWGAGWMLAHFAMTVTAAKAAWEVWSA